MDSFSFGTMASGVIENCVGDEVRTIKQQGRVINMYMLPILKPPPRYPSGRVLASSAGGTGSNPQPRTASYQRLYKDGTSSTLVWHSTLKREILALSEE